MLAFHLLILIVLVARLVNIGNDKVIDDYQAKGAVAAMIFLLGLIGWDLFILARMYHGS